ncbi:MAG: hypothetical protein LBC80_10760 [Treponema sp.]|jgi:glycosidase|nr:hypothetical protein [Treponema sp.]
MNKYQVTNNKEQKLFYLFFAICSLFFFSCEMAPVSTSAISPLSHLPNEGTWYQIFVGSFFDSTGNGIGDLRGITMKLDYLNDSHTWRHAQNIALYGECNDSLHVDGIWLTPIHPSPSYHKYDVDDYMGIDPQFGTMDDFRVLLREAHKRGMKVILDLVLNHSSDRHPWFQNALQEVRSGNPGRYAGYYHFYYGATPPQKESVDYADWWWEWDAGRDGSRWMPGRGIRGRFYRSWGNAAPGIWYEGSFWTGMPDLNFDSHHLREEIQSVADFWLGNGLDGFRLDAVHYFYLWDEIGQYEFDTIPHDAHEKNIRLLRWLNDYSQRINPNVFLIGECWRPVGVIEDYFRSGMNFFHFGTSGTIRSVLNNGNGENWARFLADWDRRVKTRNPNAVISTFLSNHDKYRSFYQMGGEINSWDDGWTEDWLINPSSNATRDQLNPPPGIRGTDRRKFAASLNILAPGTPFIYYGEEIGLLHNVVDYWSHLGDHDHHQFTCDRVVCEPNICGHPNNFRRATDDTDFRGPMWWSNTNRIGTTNPPENRRWSEAALQSRYGNGVEEQMDDYFSLLRHYIRLGNLKSRNPFIAWGNMEFFDTDNNRIAAWHITDNRPGSPTRGQRVIVAHNADYYPEDFDPDSPGGRQMFSMPASERALWIDGVCARHPDWLPTISADGLVIEMPPYTSAIIGVGPR